MKAKDADILIVPGYGNSGPEHWQSRWQQRIPSARRVEQKEWAKPGALLLDAGEAGHINVESGYGPWPEGTLAFAHFIAKL